MPRTTYFVRSAEAYPAEEAENDFKRIVSSKGIADIAKMKAKIGTVFSAVYCSPAQRAIETARGIVGPIATITIVPGFYWHPDQRANGFLSLAFNRLGDSSLANYLFDSVGDFITETTYSAIDWAERKTPEITGPDPILIVGHHPLINDLIYRIVLDGEASNSAGVAEFIKNTVLGHGEAFELVNPDKIRDPLIIRHIKLD